MKCRMSQDITLMSGQSHMHRRAVGYTANLLGTDGNMIEELYRNDKWEEVPVRQWPQGRQIKKGESIDFTCEYRNMESRDIKQGITSKDEMCMFVGVYYPRSPEIDTCADMTYVGSGAASCGETMACLAAAQSPDKTFACVVDSCPRVERPLTDFLKCTQTKKQDVCRTDCLAPTGSNEACGSCTQRACASEITACGQAACL
jgi:hypothetical protein